MQAKYRWWSKVFSVFFLNPQTCKSCLKATYFLVSLPLELRFLPERFKLPSGNGNFKNYWHFWIAALCVQETEVIVSSSSAWCCNPTSPCTRLKTLLVLLPPYCPWLLHSYTDSPCGKKGRRPKQVFPHSCLKNARKSATKECLHRGRKSHDLRLIREGEEEVWLTAALLFPQHPGSQLK